MADVLFSGGLSRPSTGDPFLLTPENAGVWTWCWSWVDWAGWVICMERSLHGQLGQAWAGSKCRDTHSVQQRHGASGLGARTAWVHGCLCPPGIGTPANSEQSNRCQAADNHGCVGMSPRLHGGTPEREQRNACPREATGSGRRRGRLETEARERKMGPGLKPDSPSLTPLARLDSRARLILERPPCLC